MTKMSVFDKNLAYLAYNFEDYDKFHVKNCIKMLKYQVFGEFSRKNAHSGTRGSKIRFRFLVRFQHLAEIDSRRFRFQKKRPKTVGSSVSVRTDPALIIRYIPT